jgi:hypothetical protein
MAKNKIKNSSDDYQIKTRHRDKKLTSMSREVKNLKENNWLNKNNSQSLQLKSINLNQANPKIKIKILKKIKKYNKKIDKKIINLSLDEKPNNQNDIKKGKIVNQKIEPKKIYIEINKYIFQGNEYFDLKEILNILYDKLKINLDSPNNKIKDKDEFKLKMNEILNKLFIIYYNKILITENNLNLFLEFLSKYIKLEPKEIIKLLNTNNIKHTIKENIQLDQYFKPRLILVEK